MEIFSAKTVAKLISDHQDIVNFGSKEHAVSEEWLRKAEARIGMEFTQSYLWFLRNYGGGDIAGEEIFSVYGIDFDQVNGGDVVYQYITDIKNGSAYPSKLPVSYTDFGEIFYFDYSALHDQECPIVVRLPSGEFRHYANDFYEFLGKRILVHLDLI